MTLQLTTTKGTVSYNPQPGDVFACWGTRFASWVIRLMTVRPRLWSPPSHVAIAADVQERLVWFESEFEARRPCLVSGRQTRGAQCHPIEARVGDYLDSGGRVAVYRLVDDDALNDTDRLRLEFMLANYCRRGLSYDYRGAVLSGTRVFQATSWMAWSQRESLFCSGMLTSVLMRMCPPRINRVNPRRMNPGRLLAKLLSEGTYFHLGDFVRNQEAD
jgi:hypothetical protein